MKTPTFSAGIAACLTLVIASLSFDASAHHSRSRFDTSEMVEIEGELIHFSWRNPHVRVQVKSTIESGDEIVWDMEGDSLSILRRTTAKPDGIELGSQVKVAGFPTSIPSNDLLLYNLLTEDGRELLVNTRAKPRWSDDASGGEGIWRTGGTAAAERGDIFRVWSTSFGPQGSFGIWRNDYPVTEFARARREAWDPLVDVAAPGCTPKGVPYIMEQPYPMEFVRDGDTILLRLEEYDTVRTIYMNPAKTPPMPEKSILGFSTGRWEDDILVITTTNIDYPYFDENGTPMGSDARLTERFWVSEDNSMLEYTLNAVDD